MPYCPICEIGFRDKRGLKGHFRFKHRLEYDTGKPARDTAFTKSIRRNIERRVSGDTMMKAIEEDKRTGELKGRGDANEIGYNKKKIVYENERRGENIKRRVFWE